MPRPYVLAETTWKAVRDTEYTVAILPWGATEAHNYHLPYGTDVIEADYISAESARLAWEQGARVVVLPTVPFGVNTGQLDIKLDINMNPSTQAAVLRDVVDAVSRAGIRKLVVLNSHGGNDFRQMIREIQVSFPETFLCTLSWYTILDQKAYFTHPDDHAGEMETSIVSFLTPDLVLPLSEAGPGKARPFKIKALRERWVWAQREWSKATADTGVGNPAEATPEKGRRYLEDVTRKISGFLVELAACDLSELYEE